MKWLNVNETEGRYVTDFGLATWVNQHIYADVLTFLSRLNVKTKNAHNTFWCITLSDMFI